MPWNKECEEEHVWSGDNEDEEEIWSGPSNQETNNTQDGKQATENCEDRVEEPKEGMNSTHRRKLISIIWDMLEKKGLLRVKEHQEREGMERWRM